MYSIAQGIARVACMCARWIRIGKRLACTPLHTQAMHVVKALWQHNCHRLIRWYRECSGTVSDQLSLRRALYAFVLLSCLFLILYNKMEASLHRFAASLLFLAFCKFTNSSFIFFSLPFKFPLFILLLNYRISSSFLDN